MHFQGGLQSSKSEVTFVSLVLGLKTILYYYGDKIYRDIAAKSSRNTHI